MRRLVLTLFVAATIGALPACTSGYAGSSLGSESNQAASVVFTNASGSYVSFLKIAPAATRPLGVTAARSKGGSASGTFTWSIRYGTTADTYQRVDTRSGLITYPSCPAVASNANAASGALVTMGSAVHVLPSMLAMPAATAPLGSGTAISPVYCLVLRATANDDVSAPMTVLVSN